MARPPSPALDTCFLYLLRHGATANNLCVPTRIQGQRSDMELSPQGRIEAEQAADCLAEYPLARFYSSPLRRALETAEIVASRHGAQVEPVAALAECDVGNWEGLSWEEIERDDPQGYRLFREAPERYGYAGGENLAQLLDRIVPALEAIMQRHLGQSVLAVTHNVINRSYLAHLLGLPLAQARGIPQHNCGLNVIRWRDGHAKPLSINSIMHLDAW